MVKLVTRMNKQRKATKNLKLFHYFFTMHFNYIIGNDIKPENIYNMDKNDFCIGHNKCRYAIVCKADKNLCLVEYNLQELVTVIKSIALYVTELLLLVISGVLSHRFVNHIPAEKEGKAKHANSKNT